MPARDSLMTGRPPIPYGLVGDGMESVNWRMLAACLDQDPELFFPIGTTASAAMQAHCGEASVRPVPGPRTLPGLGHGYPAGPRCVGWPRRVRTSLVAAART